MAKVKMWVVLGRGGEVQRNCELGAVGARRQMYVAGCNFRSPSLFQEMLSVRLRIRA